MRAIPALLVSTCRASAQEGPIASRHGVGHEGVVAAVAFFGLVSTASAEIVCVTYSGTMVSGSDLTGIFGGRASGTAVGRVPLL